jgi:O-antigen ligase
MPFATLALPLTVLAVALPFLFAVTAPPSPNFWPLVFAWTCGLVLAVWGLARGGRVHTPGQRARFVAQAAQVLAWGLLLAAVVGGVVGLLQYLGEEPLGLPWIHPSTAGQAVGNLRQRNQQATLMAMGVWALMWLWVRADQQARRWVGVALGALLPLLALASAATVSRTGALQWGLMLVLLCLWYRTSARQAIAVVALGGVLYGLAAWALPELLLHWKGIQAEGLFARLGGEGRQCVSRQVLWSNMGHLIALKPWWGWGWGELGYAHYVTLFPGERFCILLDNAHNLPLHLAVELGLPFALLLCGSVCAAAVWAKPWRESDPVRQLAWGLLALVALHSMVEYPLWYGPFQVVTIFALLLLLGRRTGPVIWGLACAACMVGAAGLATAAWQYRAVSQLYRPVDKRPADLRDLRAAAVPSGTLFPDQVRFAWLTTHPLTTQNAEQVHEVALALLHFSPEPRVIERVVDSALLLGLDEEAAFHLQRYRAAYPAEHARWLAAQAASAARAP